MRVHAQPAASARSVAVLLLASSSQAWSSIAAINSASSANSTSNLAARMASSLQARRHAAAAVPEAIVAAPAPTRSALGSAEVSGSSAMAASRRTQVSGSRSSFLPGRTSTDTEVVNSPRTSAILCCSLPTSLVTREVKRLESPQPAKSGWLMVEVPARPSSAAGQVEAASECSSEHGGCPAPAGAVPGPIGVRLLELLLLLPLACPRSWMKLRGLRAPRGVPCVAASGRGLPKPPRGLGARRWLESTDGLGGGLVRRVTASSWPPGGTAKGLAGSLAGGAELIPLGRP